MTRRGGLIGRGFEHGKSLANRRQEELARQRAAAKKLEEELDRDLEASRERERERLKPEQPLIDTLNQYAGRLVLITNPHYRLDGTRPEDEIVRRDFILATTSAFKDGFPVGVSTHAPQERIEEGIQPELDQVVDILKASLAMRGIVTRLHPQPDRAPGSYVAEQDALKASLAEAVGKTQNAGDAQGHIAITSAYGAPNVGISYLQSRGGHGYLLEDITARHEFNWQQVWD
jgi:hypothetical protein